LGISTAAARHWPVRGAAALSAGAAAWALVTLASTLQGQLFAIYHGHPQDWWATLGYTAAIFSIWALLAPVVLKVADAVTAARPNRLTAVALWALGYPVTTALHVALFVLLFWPIYGSGLPTPFAMAKPVLLANLDNATFAYLALAAFAQVRRRNRDSARRGDDGEAPAAAEQGMWIRGAAGTELVRYREIDWIAAAGDYAEVHAGNRRLLADSSLAALVDQLPKHEFARVHRGAIVRLDRVREVRRIGRGDASLVLQGGQALRLSRRYRENLARHLPL